MNRIISFSILSLAIVLGSASCVKDADRLYDDNANLAAAFDTYGLDDNTQELSPGSYSGDIQITGMATIWSLESPSDAKLLGTCSFSTTGAKAKLVLIGPNKRIATLIELQPGESRIDHRLELALAQGVNAIKIVAKKNARISLTVKLAEGNFQTIGL